MKRGFKKMLVATVSLLALTALTACGKGNASGLSLIHI